MFSRRSLAHSTEIPVASQDSPRNVDFIWGAKIPMQDGVLLNATVYKPKNPEPVPAIFTLTPYIADSYHPRAFYFAQHGYAFVLVDCRGRGNSGGKFEPFVNEGRDGGAVAAWLAAQPWCSGAVTMWGGSYGGFDQWMALKEFPPVLKTIVPVASAHAAVDFPFFSNIFQPYEMRWLTLTSGATGNANLFGEDSFWNEKYLELYRSHRPFTELDQVAGNLSSHFQTWMQHPTPDAYWKQMWLTPEEYARIDQPILSITGHFDGDQPGAMHYYRQHMLHGSPAGKAKHYLIIGPWDHPGTRTPQKEFGGLTVGDASLLDMNKLHLDWYDWTLKNGPKPDFLEDRVAYYVLGAETWKYAPSLDAISNQTKRLYLNSQDGQPNDAFHSGSLDDAPPVQSEPDRYTYDPLDTRPAEMEVEQVKNYATDQRYALNLFGNGLVYHTAPFTEATEISGYIKLELWIALDVPDTDFQVSLSEILLDGGNINLGWAMMRARYRASLEQEKLVSPGEIIRYVFDNFNFFSRQVAKGSRLRLVITCPNSILAQKNYNSGGVVADESGADARTAHITLYHDVQYPSCLELPLVIPEPAQVE